MLQQVGSTIKLWICCERAANVVRMCYPIHVGTIHHSVNLLFFRPHTHRPRLGLRNATATHTNEQFGVVSGRRPPSVFAICFKQASASSMVLSLILSPTVANKALHLGQSNGAGCPAFLVLLRFAFLVLLRTFRVLLRPFVFPTCELLD